MKEYLHLVQLEPILIRPNCNKDKQTLNSDSKKTTFFDPGIYIS